ncbi:MAG: TetR/AcrR family transcriptional regulator [Marmoricola sp.]
MSRARYRLASGVLTGARGGVILLTVLDTPKRDRVAERREATRRDILQAAWDLARENGLSSLTLRDVAERVGMRAPSLYSHFESKHAIYDAMFGQAWSDYEVAQREAATDLPAHPRSALKQMSHHYYDFATQDLARHQLMDVRVIPGFEPTPEAYAPAVRVLENGRRTLSEHGIDSDDDFDLWVAIIGGLVNQHHANDPGGTRYAGLLDRAVDMWADAVGLPPEPTPPRPRRTRR